MLLPAVLSAARSIGLAPNAVVDIAASATKGHPGEEPGSAAFWYKMLFSIGLVLAGGVFAGLTLGLMGLDELHLRVLASSSDDPVERRNATKVLRLLGKGRHWVLVVLLLGNVIVNESLPIFLDAAIGGGVAAIVISTTMIVIFGVIPQAVSVRYGLSIGAACAPIVLGMMYFFAPIAWPIAKLLDYVLGKDETHTYKKAELKTFLQFHRQGQEPLRDDEISILNGVLSLNNTNVSTIMTPMQDVVSIAYDKILDHDTVDYILRSGYSRIPVHEPGRPLSFLGLLLIKKLSVYDPSQCWPVSKFPLSILPEAHPSINCFQALDYFQTGRAHLLLLSHTPGIEGGAIGVVTLEDIIEEIISEEIVDETDRYEDNTSKKRARRMKNAAVMRGIVEYRTSRRGSSNSGPNNPLTDRTPLLARRAISPGRDPMASDTESIIGGGITSALGSVLPIVMHTTTGAGPNSTANATANNAGARPASGQKTTNGNGNHRGSRYRTIRERAAQQGFSTDSEYERDGEFHGVNGEESEAEVVVGYGGVQDRTPRGNRSVDQ